MRSSSSIFVAASLLLSQSTWAVVVPEKLTVSDREDVVHMLGLGTSSKLLTNPFPLGGYEGFEVGLSVEFIDTASLAKLGCTPGSAGCNNTGVGDRELRLPRFMVGKGLYNNVDIFLHFSPQQMGSTVTTFGGALRYSFFEAKFMPVSSAILISTDHINVGNSFEALTLGANLVTGIDADNFSLYFGIGHLQSTGTFIGADCGGARTCGADNTVDPADDDLDDTTKTATVIVHQTHSFLGVTAHYGQVFVAAELDRYPEAVYSLRAGIRF